MTRVQEEVLITNKNTNKNILIIIIVTNKFSQGIDFAHTLTVELGLQKIRFTKKIWPIKIVLWNSFEPLISGKT